MRTSDARGYEARETTRDGADLLIRAIRPDDKDLLQESFSRLSPESVYFRFFELKARLSERDLSYFTEVDFSRHVGLVATCQEGGSEHIVGVARYVVAPDARPIEAEAAFAVIDEYQNRGIGTLLLYHLANVGRGLGVEVFTGEVLGENLKMMEVFLHSGFDVHRCVDSGVIHVSFSIAHGAGGPPRIHRG